MNSQARAEALLHDLKRKEELELEISGLNKQISAKTTELHDTMEDEGVEKITIDGVDFKPAIEQTYSLSDELKGHKWDDFPDWFKWLRDNGEGGLIKVKETVPASTRTKFLKDWVAENRPLPGFISEKFFNTVKYSKAKIKRLVGGVETDEDSDA